MPTEPWTRGPTPTPKPMPTGWPMPAPKAKPKPRRPADALADGAADGLGLGVAIGVNSPPVPNSRPLSRIATKTATAAITKTFETSSRTWTAFSDGVGTWVWAGCAPRFLVGSGRRTGSGCRRGGRHILTGDFANGRVVVVGLAVRLVVGLFVLVDRRYVVLGVRLAVDVVLLGLRRGIDEVVGGGLNDFVGGRGGFDGIGLGTFQRFDIGVSRVGVGRARGSVGHPFVVTPCARPATSAGGWRRAPVYPSGRGLTRQASRTAGTNSPRGR